MGLEVKNAVYQCGEGVEHEATGHILSIVRKKKRTETYRGRNISAQLPSLFAFSPEPKPSAWVSCS